MRLSVVVTIVDAGDALVRCLAALARQQGAPDLEVIVPWDETVPGIDACARVSPRSSSWPMGGSPPAVP
jgi:hypothetical protein